MNAAPAEQFTDYAPRGAARELFARRDPELLVSGPARTGKSLACLQKLNLMALKYPGFRGLICRKTRASLNQSALDTMNRYVQPERDGTRYHGGKHEYQYHNKSVNVVSGINEPSRIMSTEFDAIYVQEAIELVQNDWESLSTRLNAQAMPYTQLLADCNPDTPTHWLYQRVQSGATAMLETRHEENPILYGADGTVTTHGAAYLARLDKLTGTRKDRLRYGRWVAAEGSVYEEWDRNLHLIDWFQPPPEWPRYWSIDFGYVDPFVFQAWAFDEDDRAYLYRELFATGRLVEDHARDILTLMKNEPPPRAIFCDHDAQSRATLERHLGMRTLPAYKAKSDGIQAVQVRLRKAGDGRPRLFVMRDALAKRDETLVEARTPASTVEEFDGYVWDQRAGQRKGDVAVDRDNHGMDAMRYCIATHDKPRPRFAAV